MYLFGAGGHAKVVIDILRAKDFRIEAVYDDAPQTARLLDIPVLPSPSGVFDIPSGCIISIGDNHARKRVSERLRVKFLTAIHPRAVVSPYAGVGEGSVIMAHAVVGPAAEVGMHCIINTGAVVEHDCRIGDFVHISPGAVLAGGVTAGEGAHVGTGAAVIQGVTIGRWAVIGAGAVILRDVPDHAVVAGNPGKIIKLNPDEQT